MEVKAKIMEFNPPVETEYGYRVNAIMKGLETGREEKVTVWLEQNDSWKFHIGDEVTFDMKVEKTLGKGKYEGKTFTNRSTYLSKMALLAPSQSTGDEIRAEHEEDVYLKEKVWKLKDRAILYQACMKVAVKCVEKSMDTRIPLENDKGEIVPAGYIGESTLAEMTCTATDILVDHIKNKVKEYGDQLDIAHVEETLAEEQAAAGEEQAEEQVEAEPVKEDTPF